MGLEEQIKQKAFASEAQKALVNINYTNGYLSSQLHSSLKEYAISVQQFNVLRIIKGQHPKPVSVNEVTTRMIDKMSNASRLVDKLFAKNLVLRKPCSYDKRQVDITLTDKGISLLDKLNKCVDEVISSHDKLTKVEFKQLNLLLDKLRNE
ncbi:MarR family transcriptional regulator [Bacteroidia bacterium]|nr:MarR family transcriptional regulator [Bacteroidia bacterium]